jgi:hypothetical protein
VELKTTPFRPEYAGQLNFYLSAIDGQVKAEDDRPSIGLLLCKDNNRLVAEYALRGMAKPMGVAEYQLLRKIPPLLTPDLPSIELIEAELASDAAGVLGPAGANRTWNSRKADAVPLGSDRRRAVPAHETLRDTFVHKEAGDVQP